MLWHSFHDSIKEGDGDRIIIHWKFLLKVFKASGRRNYTIEAFHLLAQIVLFSPRKVAELKWNRTINTVGRIGHNIPNDLHMEHLNRIMKCMMENLGSNINKKQCMEIVGNSEAYIPYLRRRQMYMKTTLSLYLQRI